MRVSYDTGGNITIAPSKAHKEDAAFDLCANQIISIHAGGFATVDTGTRIQIPKNYVGLVCSRSGMANKYGVFVLNSPGIIDPGYSGTIKVVLGNMGNGVFNTGPGMRIAQLLILPNTDFYMLPGDVYGGIRGENGLGSTGN